MDVGKSDHLCIEDLKSEEHSTEVETSAEEDMEESSTLQLEQGNGRINDKNMPQIPHTQYRVYTIRYVMLISLIVLNLSNGMVNY